jgi:uncharacterized protein (TIGR02996 family)
MAKKRGNPQEEAFLADIREHADDDGPRVIYADWLEENGNPDRAEHIRLECELARRADGDPRKEALLDRRLELLRAHLKEWTQAFPAWARPVQAQHFRRGFVEYIDCTALQFIRHGQALFRVAPIRKVWLRSVRPHVAELAASANLKGLTYLSLHGAGLDGQDLCTLLASPHLTDLRELSLSSNDINMRVPGLQALAEWEPLARVTDLHLNRCGVAGALGMLTASPHLGSLRRLQLESNHLQTEDFTALAGCPGLSSLASLVLTYNTVGDSGAAALAGSPHLGGLEALSLMSCGIGPEGIGALAASSGWKRLSHLNISGNAVRSQGARALADGLRLPALRELLLGTTQLEDDGARWLAQAPLDGLTVLNLYNNGIDWPGIRALAGSAHLASLTDLNLTDNRVGGGSRTQGVQALAESPYLGNLRKLQLYRNGRLGPEVFRLLAESRRLHPEMVVYADGEFDGKQLREIREHFAAER